MDEMIANPNGKNLTRVLWAHSQLHLAPFCSPATSTRGRAVDGWVTSVRAYEAYQWRGTEIAVRSIVDIECSKEKSKE